MTVLHGHDLDADLAALVMADKATLSDACSEQRQRHRKRLGVPLKAAPVIRPRPKGSRCWACIVVPLYVAAVFALVGWLMWPTLVGWWLAVEGWL